jgi:L-asparaginase II
VHAVAACGADDRGNVKLAMGDIEVPVYLRSAAKPFIAAAIVASGAAERFGFDDKEIAVISASHNGEPFHVECVRGILKKIGRTEADLQCGAHAPTYELAARALVAGGTTFTAVHNNCSGKHAGILALCAMLGADHRTYLERGNPAQQAILAQCARATGDDPDAWPVAVDGCGIPVFATSLRRAATAFARLATLDHLPERDALALGRVRTAVRAQPAYLAGSRRFDTDLIVATGGAVVGKAGAEGVHGDALIDRGAGLALKVVDGSRRATSPAAIALLDRLGALTPGATAALAGHATVPIKNVAGRQVGDIHALRDAQVPRVTQSDPAMRPLLTTTTAPEAAP